MYQAQGGYPYQTWSAIAIRNQIIRVIRPVKPKLSGELGRSNSNFDNLHSNFTYHKVNLIDSFKWACFNCAHEFQFHRRKEHTGHTNSKWIHIRLTYCPWLMEPISFPSVFFFKQDRCLGRTFSSIQIVLHDLMNAQDYISHNTLIFKNFKSFTQQEAIPKVSTQIVKLFSMI